MKNQNHYGSNWLKKIDLFIKGFVNHLDNEDYKTTVNNRRYDFKNAETFLLQIITIQLLKMKHANCIIFW